MSTWTRIGYAARYAALVVWLVVLAAAIVVPVMVGSTTVERDSDGRVYLDARGNEISEDECRAMHPVDLETSVFRTEPMR